MAATPLDRRASQNARTGIRRLLREDGLLVQEAAPERSALVASRRKTLLDIESLARSHTRKAIRTIAGIMNDKTAAPQARIAAARALLDRGWGRPPELAQAAPAEQPILKVVREIVHVNKTPETDDFRSRVPP